jgi:hypothetical protein
MEELLRVTSQHSSSRLFFYSILDTVDNEYRDYCIDNNGK